VERGGELSVFTLMLPALVAIAGIIALFVTIAHLGGRGIDPKVLLGITAFGGATVVGVVGMFVWLLRRIAGVHTPSRQLEKAPQPVEQRQLQEMPSSMPSVTENTTRNFEPVYKGGRQTSQ
jgi:hypothetical protein